VTALQTTDILGVDLLAAGGPYHGSGSPAGGDFYTEDDLRRIADETNRLMASGELRSPVKLGHSSEQRLLRESGFTDGEMPAAGWIDNLRVVPGSGKLVGDLRRVPSKLGALFNAGAFRTRSVELRSITSQRDGSKSGPVVSALAWLGAKAPAVRSLDDVVALYDDQTSPEEDGVTTIVYDEERWNPDWGYRSIQSAIHTRLAQEGRDFTVADVGPDRALVREGKVTWVVPFTVDEDGIELAEKGEWSLGLPVWAETAERVIEMCETGAGADNQGDMTDITLTTDQVTALAEKLGIDPETFTAEGAIERITEVTALAEVPDADAVVISKAQLAKLEADAKSGADAAAKLYAQERDSFLESAVKEGRITPGDLDKWTTRYDERPEVTREIVTEMRPVEEFVREYGREDGLADDNERALADAFDAYMGVEAEGAGV